MITHDRLHAACPTCSFNKCYNIFVFISFKGLTFEVYPSLFDENIDRVKFNEPVEFVKEVAKQKGLEVATRLRQQEQVH